MKRPSAIVSFVVHTASVYALWFAGFLLSALIVLIIPGAGQPSTLIGRALDPPFWLTEVGCGAIGGWSIGRRFHIRLSILATVVPALLLGLDIVTEGMAMRKYTSLMDIYFTANSGATEGIYKFLFVAPLYTAMAYTLGTVASKLSKTRAPELKQRGRVSQEL